MDQLERPSKRTLTDLPLVSVNATMEIQAADIFEELPAPKFRPPSIAPMAIDAPAPPPIPEARLSARSTEWLADFTSQLAAMPREVPRRYKMIVGGACALSAAIIGFAVLRTHLDAQEARRVEAAFPKASVPVVVDRPAEIDVNSLPTSAAPATIVLARKGRSLVVDGIRSVDDSVVVSCGPHEVQVGGEKARNVDVPCGSTVTVDFGTATIESPDSK